LTLKSLSGTITSTGVAGTSNTATRSAIVLKNFMLVVSNQVVLNAGPTPPANATIAVDPYVYNSTLTTFLVYLTNSTGYYYDLSTNGIAFFNISDMATTLKNAGVSESDTLYMELNILGTGPDGYDYNFDVLGSGKLSAGTSVKTGIVKTTISLGNGAGPGEYKNSDDGVSGGGFSLLGSGTPPVDEPYSTWWYDNIW
jgi:hypothetical protein